LSIHRGVALIGAGEVVHRFYVPVFESRPDIQVSAICSAGGLNATSVAKALGVPFVATDYRHVIDRADVDSVMICTPPFAHFPIAKYALEAGKNVLVEKPVCTSFEEFQSLRAIADRSKGILSATYNNAARDDNQWLIREVRQGSVGEVQLIDLKWLRAKGRPEKAWAQDARCAGGGGVLADLGSHLIRISVELIRPVSGFRGSCITCRHDPSSASDIEDVAVASMLLNDNIAIGLKVGWGMRMEIPADVSIRVYGSQGTISNKDYTGHSSDGYATLIDQFLSAAASGAQPDLEPVGHTASILHALYMSSRCMGEAAPEQR
jgi:predicted dehydrogenase